MRFALEVLQADHGDALLLHWGPATTPRLIVIDGGPAGIYQNVLGPRLAALAAERPNGQLTVDAVMISHIDDDHINGIEAFFNDLTGTSPPQVRVKRLWFNSFDRLAQGDPDDGFVSLAAADQSRAFTRIASSAQPATQHLIASVPQGNRVADLASQLGLTLTNPPFGGLITRPRTTRARSFTGLKITVLGPSQARIDDLQNMWAKASGASLDHAALAYIDDSVPNLSSIVMLIQAGRKRMLLTGDARGDDILEGLRDAGLLRRSLHLDLLKLPHHGSDRNIDTDFFRQVTADHYVISGNGKYHNPETATLAMLTDARRGDRYTIHLTNREPRLVRWFQRNRTSTDRYTINYRDKKNPSITVTLTFR